MTPEELDAIRKDVEWAGDEHEKTPPVALASRLAFRQRIALLAEVDRLAAELAAAREPYDRPAPDLHHS